MATVQPADGGFRRAADAMTGSREVARGLLFDDNDRILLVHWRDPVTGHEFLEPPGGLREPRESGEDAVRREIAEEAGIAGLEVEGFVTQIDHRFTFAGKEYDCREHYFACRLTHPANSTRSLDQVEQAGIVGVEWVSLKELPSYPSTYLEPPELLHMLKRLGRLPSSRSGG